MAADGPRPLAPEKGQRTLFSLQKVVRLDTSAVCFSPEAVQELKKILQDPSSPKYVLLTTLRKLDCFRLEFNDLVTTEIGSAVATLAVHPKLEVARLAAGLVSKWRTLIESTLFKQLPYDSELASTIPEDPPAPPPPPPGQAAATQQQQAADRKAQQELRRQQELDFLDSEDEIAESSSDDDTDEDWRPGRAAKRSAGKRKQKNKGCEPAMALEQYGNTTTYNLETVLRENIIRSQYWEKTCLDLEGWQEVVDEVYYSAEHCEPWMSGNARGPSSAFCLLYRLAQLKPTPQQIRMMLEHKDSPYIRAVGFLYLRYVCNPRELWTWFRKYVRDEEEFSPSPGSLGKTITMGDFVRDILLDQYYFETIFPRIPKPVQDEIVSELKSMGLPSTAKGNAGQGGPDRRGVDDGSKRPASVKASLSVALGQRAPNRAGAREEGRGLGAGMQGGAGASRRRSPSTERPRDREQPRRRSRSPYGGERERGGRDYDRYDKYDRRDDRRDRDGRDDRRREYGGSRRDQDRDRDRERDRDRRREDDERTRSSSGYERRRDDRGRSPRRDDSKGRDRDEGRGARDVFRDRAAGSVAVDKIRDRY